MTVTFFVRSLWVILSLNSFAFAAIHRPSRPSQNISFFYKKSEELVTKKSEVKAEDPIYQAFFGQPDHQIALIYQDQWAQHESNLPFRSSSWRGEFLSNSVSGGSVLYDWQAREQFARQVFRMRVDHGVREYLKTFKHAQAINKARSTLESLQNVSVSLGNQPGRPATQVKLGYDVLSDSSKLEIVGGLVDVGVYKSQTLANLGTTQNTTMTVTSDLGAQVGRAAISMPLTGDSIQTTLSRQISPTVSTTLSSVQPLQTRQDSSYQWNVAFSF